MPASSVLPHADTIASAFDFLHGSWDVRHRKLRRRLAGSDDWFEFRGTMRAQPRIGGAGNLDDNVLEDPAGTYSALSIRRYDAASGLWSIWWGDDRFMRLDPPVHGRFENGEGLFFGEDEVDGRPIRVRFRWSSMTSSSARWEQAFSADGGATWEVNWVMLFTRAA